MGCLVAGILPMIDNFGPLVTNVVSGLLSLVGFGYVSHPCHHPNTLLTNLVIRFLWVTIRYGEQLRAWGKVGDLTDEEAISTPSSPTQDAANAT